MEYVYCIVPDDNAFAAATGIGGAPVRRLRREGGGISALVSSLSGDETNPDVVAARVGDAEWLAPHAIAHDALITYAADQGDVIPLPMWVMFSDDAAVLGMLGERAREFETALGAVRGAREFGVRVSADRAALEAVADRIEGSIGALSEEADAAPPGRAYLLRRRIAALRTSAVRDVAIRLAEDVHSRLSGLARASVSEATALAKEPGVVLDGAYLVQNADYESFRAELTDIIGEYEPSGVRFEFTGPWPPYRFIREH